MLAKEIFEKYKKDIKIINDAMRYTGRPGHVESLTRDVFISSSQPFEPELDFLSSQAVGAEIVGNRTTCQVIPIGKRDLKMSCVETEYPKDVNKIKKCISPIAENVILELADLSIEQEKAVIGLIEMLHKGTISTEQASKEYKEKLKASLKDEDEIIRYYTDYKNKNCGKIGKTLSRIETREDKVIQTEIKRTKSIHL